MKDCEFWCPKCEQRNEVDLEDLPDAACDNTVFECENCGTKIKLGWSADVEVRGLVSEEIK